MFDSGTCWFFLHTFVVNSGKGSKNTQSIFPSHSKQELLQSACDIIIKKTAISSITGKNPNPQKKKGQNFNFHMTFIIYYYVVWYQTLW